MALGTGADMPQNCPCSSSSVWMWPTQLSARLVPHTKLCRDEKKRAGVDLARGKSRGQMGGDVEPKKYDVHQVSATKRTVENDV